MMPIDWQLIIALLFVAGAGVYLALKVKAFFQQVRSGKGCASSCGATSCSANSASQQSGKSTVTVELQTFPQNDHGKNK